jgi:hypothetical protein
MTHDRVARDDIPLTHELIARILGVRRAGVSAALDTLRAANLIAIERGNVRVLNIEGIHNVAGRFYGLSAHNGHQYVRNKLQIMPGRCKPLWIDEGIRNGAIGQLRATPASRLIRLKVAA